MTAKGKKKTPNPQAAKQLTMDYLPTDPKKEPHKTTTQIHEKKIIITEIGTSTKENELALKVSFKLLPSKIAFSRGQLDL